MLATSVDDQTTQPPNGNRKNNQSSNLLSDEENTSEYSHHPSSEHSTLESNPGVSINLHSLAKEDPHHRYGDSCSSTSSSSSDDSEDCETLHTKQSCSSSKIASSATSRSGSGRRQSGRRQSARAAVDTTMLNNNNRVELHHSPIKHTSSDASHMHISSAGIDTKGILCNR